MGGFSFRSLYSEQGTPGLEAMDSLSATLPDSVARRKQAASNPHEQHHDPSEGHGIPGPLTDNQQAREAANQSVSEFCRDDFTFLSLDALEPLPVESEDSRMAGPQAVPSLNSEPDPGLCDHASFVSDSQQGRGKEAQITLRALFAAIGPFELPEIAMRTAGFAGVASCLIKTPSQVLLAEAGQDEVREISNTVDIPQIEDFQAMSDQLDCGRIHGIQLLSESGPVSCFSSGHTSLMVRHDAEEPVPGLREKLLLITRSIAAL